MTPTTFEARRQQLMAQCAPSSIVILPAASQVTRSNDTEYPFRQDSDFWYLTGFNEPEAFLILSNAIVSNNPKPNSENVSILFLQPKDPHAEVWHGRRLGEEAAPSKLSIDEAYSIESIEDLLPDLLNGHDNLYFCLGKYPEADGIVQTAIANCKAAPKQAMIAPPTLIDVSPMVHEMRRIKSSDELQVMAEAASISADAHKRAMRFVRPGVFEYQLEAQLHHEFAMRGAKYPAYGTIVGSGNNACILHYTENSDQIEDGDLVLIDAGCELEGYAADITRTFPSNGRFSPAQKALYQLVLDSQLAALAQLTPGNTIADGMQACVKVIVAGLIELGILQGELEELIEQEAWRPYFMHGLGHYLGLDVHDVGIYKVDGQDIALEPGVVITVEPGLYISEASDAPKKYRGIGIRIEDDIVITESGHDILTHGVPKTIEEIEEWMAGGNSL
jgi:Xaa-Pro aminopeptidase